MRKLLHFSILIFSAAALLAGCSDSNPAAEGDVHPANWYQLHRTSTSASTFAVDCGGCHVVKDQPSPAVPPSCFSSSFDGLRCHPSGPGQAPHPLDGSYLNPSLHGKDAKADLTFCQGCHSDKPDAGPGDNPRFNVGIDNPLVTRTPGNGCEGCHLDNYAHPEAWAGPNNTFHYSAGNIQAACTLCHGANLSGPAEGGVGIDCTTCHAEATNFTLNCDACHGFPPDGVNTETEVIAEGGAIVNHIDPLNPNILTSSHDQCATCHGVKNTNPSGTTGNLNPSANYLAFNKTTDIIGDHWNGQINMNADTEYDDTTFGCNFTCHVDPTGHQLPNSSNLTVELGNYGAISATAHPVGDKWLIKSQHATEAVNGSLNCVGCHTQTGGGIDPPCQSCHQTAPNLDLTTTGCDSCHSYPPDGVDPPTAGAPNQAGQHAKHFGLTTDTGTCGACHQGGGTDSLTHYDRTATTPNLPAEVVLPTAYNGGGAALYDSTPLVQTCGSVSCHGGITTPNWYTGTLPTESPTVSNAFCLSCHMGNSSVYNGFVSGRHDLHVNNISPASFRLCVNCHNTTVLQDGVGGTGPTHWSDLDTQVFELDPADTVGGTGTLVNSYDGSSCNPACHGSETW